MELVILEKTPIALDIGGKSELELGLDKSTGTTNYNALTNKPSIEDVVLVGNKTFKQLGLEAMTEQDIDDLIYGGSNG